MALNLRNLWNDLATAGAPPSTANPAPGGGLELPPELQDAPPVDGPFPVTPPKPAAPVLESMTLIPNKTSIAVGESVQVSAIGKFSDGSSRPVTGECMWSGGSPSVLQVSGNGSAAGMSPGTGSITALHMKYTSVTNSTKITVTGAGPKPPEPVLEQIILDPGAHDVQGGEVSFTAWGKFPGWPDENLTNVVNWSSDKPAVAAIAGNGIVKTKSPGTAIITAKHGNRKATATVTVRGGDQPKAEAKRLLIVPSVAFIKIGEPIVLTPRRLLPDGTANEVVKGVVWALYSADVVTYTAQEDFIIVTGKSPGQVRINASYRGASGDAFVTVQPEAIGTNAPAMTSTIQDVQGQTGGSPSKPVPPTPTKDERVEVIPQLPDMPPPGPLAPAPLSGKSNDVILGLQKALKKVGYDPGPVDGILGPKTSGALKQFQRDNGLAADGVAGPLTQAAMAKALRAASGTPGGAALTGGGGSGTIPQIGTSTLEVHVHNEAGIPVDGVTVRLSTGPTPKPDTETNAGGIARFDGLADGDYHVNAAKLNIVWQPAYVRQGKLMPGQTFVVTLSKLAKPAGQLGVCVLLDWERVAGACVLAQSAHGGQQFTEITNNDGVCSFKEIPAGDYQVMTAVGDGYTGSCSAHVEAGTWTGVDLHLNPPISL